MTRLDRITSDQTICHGQPTIHGTRHTVELSNDDILAALEFGALSAGSGRVIPLKSA